MTDDPIPTILASLSRLEQGQERLAAGQTKLEAGLSNLEADQKRTADGVGRLEARQDAILGTINDWMERLRDDQKAALGHATMAFTVAHGQSQAVENLNQLFYELQKRVQDIEERLRDDKHDA